jgi:hypothetical protein
MPSFEWMLRKPASWSDGSRLAAGHLGRETGVQFLDSQSSQGRGDIQQTSLINRSALM